MDDRHRAAGNGGAVQNPAYRPTHPLRAVTCEEFLDEAQRHPVFALTLAPNRNSPG
jgi:hypothetical protein